MTCTLRERITSTNFYIDLARLNLVACRLVGEAHRKKAYGLNLLLPLRLAFGSQPGVVRPGLVGMRDLREVSGLVHEISIDARSTSIRSTPHTHKCNPLLPRSLFVAEHGRATFEHATGGSSPPRSKTSRRNNNVAPEHNPTASAATAAIAAATTAATAAAAAAASFATGAPQNQKTQ